MTMQFREGHTYYEVGLAPAPLKDVRLVEYRGPAQHFCHPGALCFQHLDDKSEFACLSNQDATCTIVDLDGLLKILATQLPNPRNRSAQLIAKEVWDESANTPRDHLEDVDTAPIVIPHGVESSASHALLDEGTTRSLEIHCPIDEVLLEQVSRCTLIHTLRIHQGPCLDWEALGSLQQLKDLEIQGATLDWSFANAIRNCPQISTLSLRKCTLDKSVCEGIRDLAELRNLDLSASDASGISFTRKWRSESVLRCLLLRDAQISTDMLRSICTAFSRLSLVDVSGTTVDDDLCRRIASLPSTRTLLLRNTPTTVSWVIREHLANEHCRIVP